MKPLIAVVGPTGSGKSTLALALAARLNGEIVNCDSLQIYRGLDIGTAKTPPADRLAIPHHLFDLLSPGQSFSAGDFARAARATLDSISARARLPILAGGTGFYLRALLHGLNAGPQRNETLRARLARNPARLHRLLARLDPQRAAAIHPNDSQKLIRALEIRISSRRPVAAAFQTPPSPLPGFNPLIIGLHPPRTQLHQRIAARTRAMFDAGLLDEVRSLLNAGVPPNAKAFESIGYKESVAHLQGRISLAQAVELTTIATRQYAKRQLTWFRADNSILWIDLFGDHPLALTQALAWSHAHLSQFTLIN